MYSPLAPGTRLFNGYDVIGLVGQGEFGLSYLAHDQNRFRELCLLQEFAPLHGGADHLERLRQRFHQGVAPLYDWQHEQLPHYRPLFAQGERLYLARNYILGKSYGALLAERRAEGRAFSQAEVVYLLTEVLPILGWLHQLGVVHQNLSPHSIVVQESDQVPMLVDFGLIRYWVARLQLHPVAAALPCGAMGYMPPEQLQGNAIAPGWDVYALGMTAIALLLGKPANECGADGWRSLPWEKYVVLHPELRTILKRMVHPDPAKRWPSCGAVLRALQPIAAVVLAPGAELTTSPRIAAIPTAKPRLQARSRPPTRPRRWPQVRDRVARWPGWSQLQGANPDWRASAVLVVSVAVLISVVSFKALSWVQPEPDRATPAAAPANPAVAPKPSSSPSPPLPTREPPSTPPQPDSQSDRGAVSPQFLAKLADELFYANHPELGGKPLGEEADPALREEWKTLYDEVAGKVSQLPPAVQQKLGRYQRADYDRWLAPASGASLNERELNVLVNRRFGQLFPAQKGKTLNPATFGQVWYAIADEELNTLKPKPDS